MSRENNKKGIALITAIIVVSMVSLMLTSYIATVIAERKRVEHETATASAEYIARAGLEKTFIDLSCEYEKDGSWIDDNTINERIIDDNGNGVLNAGEGMPLPTANVDPDMSDYQRFYGTPAVPLAFAGGNYEVWIAFVKNTAGNAFKDNRLWVKATGRVLDTAGNTIDEVTLTQLARVRRVKNITIDTGLGRLYDYLDPAEGEANSGNEIRIIGATLDEDVTIANKTITIRGGYGYDFSDGSRDTSANRTTLKDSAGGSVVDISGTGTVTMGGVRIE